MRVCADALQGRYNSATSSKGGSTLTEIRKELPASPVAPSLARQALDGWLSARVGEQTVDDIRLATTELVSNAVRHGELGEQDLIVLSGTVEDVFTVYVEQPTAIPAAEAQPPGPLDESGAGLRLLDAIATRWGVDPGPPGVVWFEVDR